MDEPVLLELSWENRRHFHASIICNNNNTMTRQRMRLRGLWHTRRQVACTILCFVTTLAVLTSRVSGDEAATAAWSGSGAHRVIVEVESPIDGVSTRSQDAVVASCDLEMAELLRRANLDGKLDVSSVQVHQLDAATGDALPASEFASARSPFDLPCRFDDLESLEPYPDRAGRASETPAARPAVVPRERGARLFNRTASGESGRLVWYYVATATAPQRFAIYFDLLPQDAADVSSPAPWIGDADVLRFSEGAIGGFSHFTCGLGDLNGDGLVDIVAGTEKGDLYWFANIGNAVEPKFGGCELLRDADGPIDVGWYAAPVLFDWDDDGRLDLLVGTSGNVILWWRNEGSAEKPQLAYQGFVQSDGERLEVPEAPVAEDVNDIFQRDYFNQPWIGDIDGDRLPDLVTGGYTTGQIFVYRGVSRSSTGVPQLAYSGTLQSEGKPIDTIWAAAPACLDANGDGVLDLVTGGWRWSGILEKPAPGDEDLLRYYEGEKAAKTAPLSFVRRDFPGTGNMPAGSIARPNVIDANGDGLLDLFVSESGGNAYLLYNVGTASAPRWDTSAKPITIPWAFTRDFDVSATTADLNGDGRPESLVGNAISCIEGSASSPSKRNLGVAHVNGAAIEHPGPGYGDPYYFSIFCNWDDDGHPDILWGDQQGNVYLHRGVGGDDPLAFSAGELLKLVDGAPLRVGPEIVSDPKQVKDFTVLQGSRIVIAYADFDGDGIDDLITGDTFSDVNVFRGVATETGRAFEPAVLVGKLPSRPEAISCTDWNGDSRPDLLIGGSTEEPVVVYLNTSEVGRPALGERQAVAGLPYMFWGSKVQANDWNLDGDVDLMIQSEFLTFWAERSFLENGYRRASIISLIEHRPSADKQR